MATRSAIGTIDAEGHFRGRYVMNSGYPTWRGPMLARLLAKHGLTKLLKVTTEKHYAWSTLAVDQTTERPDWVGKDRRYRAVPGFGIAWTTTKTRFAPEGQTGPEEWVIGTLGAESDTADTEWGYYFAGVDTEAPELVIAVHDGQPREVARIKIDELGSVTEGQWAAIECGFGFERCTHMASYHVKGLPKASRSLGMQTWLGLRPLTARDAIGAVINGRRYVLGGSGSLRGGWWYCSAKYANGRPAPDQAIHTGERFGPDGYIAPTVLPGVKLVYPPTAVT